MESSGLVIARVAFQAMSDGLYTPIPGECQMFARQVAEHSGEPAQEVMDTYRKSTAAQTWASFQGTHYAIWDTRKGGNFVIQEGDFLYKSRAVSGFDGHVGIAVNGHRVGLPSDVIVVIENSHYHTQNAPVHAKSGNVQGAKGWRVLDVFGEFSGIVRLA